MRPAALVIAGTHSGVGKTTVSIALMAALRRRGLRVQPFKVGPDFIDPTLHTRAAGRASRNLDGWMLSREANLALFAQAARGADIAVIEGVMGLYDGCGPLAEAGSTAEMAKLLGLPVVLIVDAWAMARSAAALVRGYESFDEQLDIAGVIFNRVSGPGHFACLRDAVNASCRARVIGWLPVDDRVALPERHLGLLMGEEILGDERLGALAAWIEAGLDIDALVQLTRESPAPADHGSEFEIEASQPAPERQFLGPGPRRVRIGVARDRAFCFYYQDNLDLLASLGAEIVEFSPIADPGLPRGLDGLYFGGGYPELYAAQLAANARMRADVARFVQRRLPVYAECGGFMYLSRAIIDLEETAHPMVGVFPAQARMRPRLAALGYAEVETVGGAGWLPGGLRARGHEFRYSVMDEMPAAISRRYRVAPGGGAPTEGYVVGGALASYIHLHFRSCPQFAAHLVAACAGPGFQAEGSLSRFEEAL
jgi:cobyrinic acid a,c-diamide synthase